MDKLIVKNDKLSVLERLKRCVATYYAKNRKLLNGLLIAYIAGASLGVFFALMLSNEERFELIDYISGFAELFGKSTNQNTRISLLFWNNYLTYLKPIFIVWILGASLVGIPLIFVLPASRGFISLFCIIFLVSSFGLEGLKFSLLNLAMIELYIIPATTILCANAVNYSLSFFKSGKKEGVGNRLFLYSVQTACFGMLAALPALCEVMLIPRFIYLLI